MNNTITHNKPKSLLLIRTIFIICFLGSLTGFPWAFIPWETVSEMTNSQKEIFIDSSMSTIFLFRIQCLFFGAFAGFYIFMAYQPIRYKNLIFISSLLMLLMSGAMVIIRDISGLHTSLTNYEHYLWLVIGIIMLLSWFFILRKSKTYFKNKSENTIFTTILKIIGIVLFFNIFWITVSQNNIEKILKLFSLPSYFGNPYAEYASGLIFLFLGIFGIIIFICSLNSNQYKPILKFIAIYSIFIGIYLIISLLSYNNQNIFTIIISLLSIFIGTYILISTYKKQLSYENTK